LTLCTKIFLVFFVKRAARTSGVYFIQLLLSPKEVAKTGLRAARTSGVNFIQLLLSPKEVAKKSARFSKRGKESSTVIYSSHFATRLAQCVSFWG